MLTTTSDPSAQLLALENLKERLEQEFQGQLLAMAPKYLSHFVEYMTPDEPPAPHHDWLAEKLEAIERRDIMRACFSMPPGHAKSLDLLCDIMTDKGWKKFGELVVGDRVLGTDGRFHNVIAQSEIFYKPCYKAITSDGEEIIASEDHLWTVRWSRNKKEFTTNTTKELYDFYNSSKEPRAFMLPPIAPYVGDGSTYSPVDPYLLGVWLGDGKTECGRITSGDEDRWHFDKEFEKQGWKKGATNNLATTYYGFGAQLRHAGLLGNKHIPELYHHLLPEQRLALIQGLMDTDGNCRDNGGCRFVNTDERLIDDLRRLLWGLGIPNTKQIVDDGEGPPAKDGYYRSKCWVVNFSGLDCFRLPRKVARLAQHKKRYGRYITFEKVEQRPTRCISVDSADELFLVGRSFIPTHNTKICTRMFAAWYLGRNPKHKYFQGGHSQAFCETQFGKPIRELVGSAEYRNVFPEITISDNTAGASNWMLGNGRGGYITKGVGQKIAGFRGHIGSFDDIIGSREDADSPVVRQKVWDWLWADFRTRLLPKAPIFGVATRWNDDDPIGRIEQYNKESKGHRWEIFNLTAIVENELEMALDPLGRGIGEVIWPDFYDVETIMELKETLPAKDWNSLYKGKPVNEEGNLVKASRFHWYDKLPSRGSGRTASDNMVRKITVSVDTANKVSERADPSALTVWVQDHFRRHYLAEVVVDKMELPQLTKRIEDLALKWGADAILVEDAGAGTQYIQTRRGKAPAPIIPILTKGKSKEFRFDAVSDMFASGDVLLPRHAVWLADYLREILEFPTGATDNQVDSTSQYLNYSRPKVKLGTKRMRKGDPKTQ